MGTPWHGTRCPCIISVSSPSLELQWHPSVGKSSVDPLLRNPKSQGGGGGSAGFDVENKTLGRGVSQGPGKDPLVVSREWRVEEIGTVTKDLCLAVGREEAGRGGARGTLDRDDGLHCASPTNVMHCLLAAVHPSSSPSQENRLQA